VIPSGIYHRFTLDSKVNIMMYLLYVIRKYWYMVEIWCNGCTSYWVYFNKCFLTHHRYNNIKCNRFKVIISVLHKPIDHPWYTAGLSQQEHGWIDGWWGKAEEQEPYLQPS
jgi:hypothetical protein